jgi:multidrug efflux system outer membrane protein
MKHMKWITPCLLVGALALAGCTMAPRYTRPKAPVPAEWPRGPSYENKTAASPGQPVVDTAWQDFYLDGRLRQVIALSLQNNRDLRVAALNVEKVQAQYRIQRAALLPEVDVAAVDNNQAQMNQQYAVGVGFSSYELDLFGRVRSLKDQALEQYLATEQAQRTVRIGLVAGVAAAYLGLAADREWLQLARETLRAQEATLQLTQRRFDVGVASELDLRQAQTQVESAKIDFARYTTLTAQDKNSLDLLVGARVGEDLLPQELAEDLTAVRDIAPGLPSEVLLLRPDVVQAEDLLKGYNASIGAARANFFPSITLSTSIGTASDQLSNLFKSGNGYSTFSGQVVLPIFDTGSRRAQLKVAETDKRIAGAQYEKAIQTAFREVADALAQRGTIDGQLAAQRALVEATDKRFVLSRARYDKGIDSYLSVLDAQRSLYSARQALIGTRLTRLLNLVTLYKVLGGGWQEHGPAAR